MRVSWDRLSQPLYDDMVAVLLSRLHPAAQRVDGAGGDEGRDVHFDSADGEWIFQLKSFTGRLSASRKGQIRKSLNRVAASAPAQWFLVAPIDLTPTEERWFRDLGREVSFPIVWHGRTWLDSQIARFPEVAPYFIEDSRHEVLAMLRELREEEAIIASATDAVGRLRHLHARLNEIDPYFRYDLSIGSSPRGHAPEGSILVVDMEDVRITVFERYRAALLDRPITGSFELRLDPEDVLIAHVQDAFEYGLPVSIPAEALHRFTLDAPGGLGGEFSTGALELSAARVARNSPVVIQACVEKDGNQLAALPLVCEQQSVGTKGAVLNGADSTGWLTVTLRVTPGEKRLAMNLRLEPKVCLPSALLPLVHWGSFSRPPNELVLRIQGSSIARMTIPETWFPEQAQELVEVLACVQQETGAFFPMPVELLPSDWAELREACRLLKGETIESSWKSVSFEMSNYDRDHLLDLAESEGRAFRLVREEWLVIDGNRIPLGQVTVALPVVRARDPDQLRKHIRANRQPIQLTLVPGSSDKMLKFIEGRRRREQVGPQT